MAVENLAILHETVLVDQAAVVVVVVTGLVTPAMRQVTCSVSALRGEVSVPAVAAAVAHATIVDVKATSLESVLIIQTVADSVVE